MDNNLVVLIIEIIALVGCYLLGKYKPSNNEITKATDTLALVMKYAESYVTYAREFMSTNTGEEKMAKVVEMLGALTEKYNINISQEELTAIAQRAYELVIKQNN